MRLFAVNSTEQAQDAKVTDAERSKDFDVLNMSQEEFQLLSSMVQQYQQKKIEDESEEFEINKMNVMKKELAQQIEHLKVTTKKIGSIYQTRKC